ncbi:MAG: PBP1A family penicillin-binding protein [Thermicanus sp.]|nr:PBP1A family penicillin-binding protein [Thermicanus sp.]
MIRFIVRLVQGIILSFLLMILGGLFFVLYLGSQPLPPADVEESSFLYTADGELLETLHQGINRQTVPLDQIPATVRNATIAIEDRYFYQHFGFDPKRIAASLLINLQEGKMVQGASTITQQLARNLYLSHDKTWERKLRELLLSIQLELNYSKDQILEMYLNQIYYGNSAYGIESASHTYLGKSAKELTLAEAALLAGIPKGPTYYEPYHHFENAKKRQRLVLNAMVENGYITREEADRAYQEEIHLIKGAPKKVSIAPYFRDAVLEWIDRNLGLTPSDLNKGGYRIYTTLSLPTQKKAEEAVAKRLPKEQPLQVALVAIEPGTGYVRAMVGGRDYEESQYNRVYAKRQPGSTFKPFLYLAALENGMTPLTKIESKPTVFQYEGKLYSPNNYHKEYAHDYITMLEAIKKSDNIYAITTHMTIGPEKLVNRAKELGIETPLQAIPSLPLGSIPLSPMEMVTAYATIANAGEKVEPILVTRIEDRNGKVIYSAAGEKKRVADSRYVSILIRLMQAVFEKGGTAYSIAGDLKRPVAGKTGSTPYDGWMIGFTPQLAAAVWVGFDKNQPLSDVDSYRSKHIWADFMEGALSSSPPMLFPLPDGLISAYIDPETGELATVNCPDAELLYFIPGTEPTTYCTKHPAPDKEKKEREQKTPKKSLWERMKEWWE